MNQINVHSVQAIVDKHAAVFNGVGKLKDNQFKIDVDPEVTPVAQPQRRVPFHVRKDVEKRLEELQNLDIIEDVNGQSKRFRSKMLCVDMCQENEADTNP